MDNLITKSAGYRATMLATAPPQLIISSMAFISSTFYRIYNLFSTGNPSFSSKNLNATNTWQELEFPYYNSSLLGGQDLYYVVETEDQTKTVSFQVSALISCTTAHLLIYRMSLIMAPSFQI